MGEGKDSNVAREGKVEIARYLEAERQLVFAKSEQNKAMCELANAATALGKWLTPENAKDGEQFCVWHAGHLIQATRKELNTFEIVIRERPRR